MYNKVFTIEESIKANKGQFAKVLPFDARKDKLVRLDLSEENKDIDQIDFLDTKNFEAYISKVLSDAKAKYAFGGYNELRAVYARSSVFSGAFEGEEPRRLHLGVDIWGAAGTPVHAPLGGMVHSFAYNNRFGDYGATIILQHQLDTQNFYTLYGHLSKDDLAGLSEGKYFTRGQVFAHLGQPEENGNWPPHLHFQIIKDIGIAEGDYPGVCKFSERKFYLENCPDPEMILDLTGSNN